MAKAVEVVSHIVIEVNGTALDEEVRSRLLAVEIDQHVHLPGMFSIRLQDPDLKLLDAGPFNLAEKVTISGRDAENQKVRLIQGEITAIEPEFGAGMMVVVVVRVFDQLHRLYRQVKNKTYLNVKDSDIAEEIALAAGLKVDIEATATVYEHLYQHNQSDLAFLMQRARRIGYDCYIRENTLIFRNPNLRSAQATLAWGADLLTFHPRMTLSEQVEEVLLQGWDVQKKEKIVGRATQGKWYPKIQEQADGGVWAKKLEPNSKQIVVDDFPVSQAEADILASARLNEISGAFVEAHGTAFRRPDITAGQVLKIERLGQRFCGEYLVTSATHIYTDAGFKTNFTVSGGRTGLLIDQLIPQNRLNRWSGFVPAIVTNTDDPNNWGRVKVKYPWMSDSEESQWARVLGIGAGPTCGFSIIPAINDEVMVAFQHGDFNVPIVVGGMWNGQDALPNAVNDVAGVDKPTVHSWTSREGHRIILSDSGKSVTIQSSAGLELCMDDNGTKITVKSNADIEVLAGSSLRLKGGNISIEADGSLDMNASGPVTVKGATINLN